MNCGGGTIGTPSVNNNKYSSELEGQQDFYKNFKNYIPEFKDLSVDEIMDKVCILSTDGTWDCNILEFKLKINDINATLFQVIKYLSKFRIVGHEIPRNIILIDCNGGKAYLFDSKDYLEDIEKVYLGGASRDNEGQFNIHNCLETIYYNSIEGSNEMIKILRGENDNLKTADNKVEKYTKINIDESCVVGWAERFYKENPNADKGAFLGSRNQLYSATDGEIYQPSYFKQYINPLQKSKEETNERFKFLMDKLNDRVKKKELGAFYTPKPYCKLGAELVMEAIKKVPEGNDYIILDRCAGTGNLEEALIELMGEEEARKHIIVSTIEYYEYKVMQARIGDKVKCIIPPNEEQGQFDPATGYLKINDALSFEYVNMSYLKEFINNDKMTIILFENPPYRDITAGNSEQQGSDRQRNNTDRWLVNQMNDVKGATKNDIANQFIWSAFKYYLRQSTDSYIIYSPVKYFKSCGLANKQFNKGYLLNRQHFHAGASAVSLMWWQNIDEDKQEYKLDAMNIKLKEEQGLDIQEQTNQGEIIKESEVEVKKVSKRFSDVYYDKRKFDDDVETNIHLGGDGYLAKENCKKRVKSIYNQNIIGYLDAHSNGLDLKTLSLLRQTTYHGDGFYLRQDNFIEKLPMFCAKLYPQKNWYERDVYFTTADGGMKFVEDKEFLKCCLIFTCLSQRNHCRSFQGTDGRFYKNELCFDNTNGDTEATKQLKQFEKAGLLNEDDNKLLEMFNQVLLQAKDITQSMAQDNDDNWKTRGKYNSILTYGTYQIEKEINTFYQEGTSRNKKNVYHYPELNGNIKTLKTMLNEYYEKHIQPKLFEYELLK